MDVDEGFIVGIYNYCDRWCETCRLTSRCRLFADGAEGEALSTPELRALHQAPPHPSDVRPMPGWLEDMMSEMKEDDVVEWPSPPPMPGHLRRAVALGNEYSDHAWGVLSGDDAHESLSPNDPRSIILWFASLIPAKTGRALDGLHQFDGCREYPPDHEGSAKVVLLGIDRSIEAWADARTLGYVSANDAQRMIGELHQLCSQIEDLIPQARGFVRPGFDELDEVRKLEATDWS